MYYHVYYHVFMMLFMYRFMFFYIHLMNLINDTINSLYRKFSQLFGWSTWPLSHGGVPRYRCHVLDINTLEPVADGQRGVLFVGGIGLARGYLEEEEKTKARPTSLGLRMLEVG